MSTAKNKSSGVGQTDAPKPVKSPEARDKEQLDDERLDSVSGGLGSVAGGQLDTRK